MSSDSSEEEDLSAFQEAAVPISFQNSFLASTRFEDGSTKKAAPKPSLRSRDDEDEHNHMGVSPEFQSFIAQQLSKFLDSKIKEVDGSPVETLRERKKESGIRLLGASGCFLVSEDEAEPKVSYCRKKRQSGRARFDDTDNLTEEQKCQEAAVSADWVLSKQAVAGWEPNPKGNLVLLKASEVVLVQGPKKDDKREDSGEGKSGLVTDSKPQHAAEEERREKKKLKRFLRKERLKQEKAKANATNEGKDSNGESSANEAVKKTKRKREKSMSPENISEITNESSEEKNGLFHGLLSDEERRQKKKVKRRLKEVQLRLQEANEAEKAECSGNKVGKEKKTKRKKFLLKSGYD